jgi:LPS-assembly protein
LSLQAGWQTQWVGGGGFVATPYVGGRGDFAYYDGKSAALPVASSLWSATPIAAMDIRYPLMANSDGTVHIVEPIVQAVYRGSDTTRVGITNDDAQSFVFDDTNLFNYNRFSGSDRQETGLRANLGGRYQVNFIDGSYLELIAGQSYQIAGANAFADAGQAQTGVGAGVAGAASYAVVGGYGATASGLKGGAKLLVNTGNAEVAKAGLGVGFANSGYSASVDYSFLSANPGVGMIKDQHEVSGSVGVPIAEYWRVTGNAAWDLSNNHWLQVGGGVTYDDGYLSVGAGASRNGPTHTSPNATSVNASIVLKAPAGFNIGHAGAVPATLLNSIGF